MINYKNNSFKKGNLEINIYFLFFYILILLLFGLIFVYSSSLSCENFFYIKKQLLGIFFCIFFILLFSSINSKFYIENSFLFFLISLMLCLITKMPKIGICLNGASRWINLYFFSFQPVEILKPFYIIFFSKILSIYQFQIKKILFFTFLLISITSIVLLLQPDFGHCLILIGTTLIIFFATKPKKKLLISIFLILFLSTVIIAISKPYRIKRLLIFLNPWNDPQGSGFQIIQSLIAINNGNFFGVGIGKSIQKLFFLPMQNTDFIFSVICEEGGIFLGSILILLFLYLIILIISISEKISEEQVVKKLSVLGFGILIGLQSSMNILVSTATIPTKGIGLPFISYGISSLIGIGVIFGILFSFLKNE